MLDSPAMRLLVIFPGALGDLICLGPALRAIARRHHDATLELMARPELARFAVGRMGIEAGHSIDRREVSSLFRNDGGAEPRAHAFFGQFGRIYSFFASDDHNFRRRLGAAACGEVSFHRFRPPGDGHLGRLYLDSVGACGEPLESHIDLARSDFDSAAEVLHRVGAAHGKFCLVFPGSGSMTKNWPLDRFLELAKHVSPIVKPLAILGPAESAMEASFQERQVAALKGLELNVVAALAHHARAFVGNDSGVSHLAAAAGARGIVIFGPTDSIRWQPLGEVTVVRRKPLDALAVTEVLQALRALVACEANAGEPVLV
jgi:heptosyltransferase III